MSLRLADFDFDLPERLIARYPASPRDSARLLAVGPSMADRQVRDLPDLLRAGDLLVFNDTKVIPAQLSGRRAGRAGGPSAKIEVTLHKRESADSWRAFAKPARRLDLGDHIVFAEDFFAEVTAKSPEGDLALRFNLSGSTLRDALQRHGEMPLPPISASCGPPGLRMRTTTRPSMPGPRGRSHRQPPDCISRRHCWLRVTRAASSGCI